MTTRVTVHVNGRYRATVKQDGGKAVIVDGNYEGSPNPSGDQIFYLPDHPAKSKFEISERAVPAEAPKE